MSAVFRIFLHTTHYTLHTTHSEYYISSTSLRFRVFTEVGSHYSTYSFNRFNLSWDISHTVFENKLYFCRIAFSSMLCRVAVVRAEVSEEHSASIIRVTRIGELGTLALTSNVLVTTNVVPSSPILVTLILKAMHSSETSVLSDVSWSLP
jgi:hypothetical protein